MAAVYNYVKYEGIIISAKVCQDGMFLVLANTQDVKAFQNDDVLKVRVKLNSLQTEKAREVLYLEASVLVEGRIASDGDGLFIEALDVKYKNQQIDIEELRKR